jgi:proteasome lid subunit RPN8/RPN11
VSSSFNRDAGQPAAAVWLSAAHATAIRDAAAAAYPEECCGLLVGWRDNDGVVHVNRIVASGNVAASPRDAFEVDAQVRFDVTRAVRGTNEAIVGHYHSHPDGPAVPSARDLAQAYEPDLIWLIVAARSAGRPEAIGCFRVEGTPAAAIEVALVVLPR